MKPQTPARIAEAAGFDSVRVLAEQVGVSPRTLRGYFNGSIVPPARRVKALAGALHVEPRLLASHFRQKGIR